MLGKLSKSRKKIKDNKQPPQKNSKPKLTVKENQKKHLPKPSHQVSTLSLLKNHNMSQCSLISQAQKHPKSKKKHKGHESSVSIIGKLEKYPKKESKSKKSLKMGKKSKEKISPSKINPKLIKKK